MVELKLSILDIYQIESNYKYLIFMYIYVYMVWYNLALDSISKFKIALNQKSKFSFDLVGFSIHPTITIEVEK